MMDKLQIEHLRNFISRDSGDISPWYKVTCLRILDELEEALNQRDQLYVDNMSTKDGSEDR